VFCRPEDVHQHLVHLVNGINELLDRKHNAYAVAAGALLGLLNVHPWRDGNGRVARILVSYVLRRSGVPFPVILTAGTEQRRTYVAALRECVYSPSPTVTPMADLIAGHAARVWDALERARVGVDAVAEARREAASTALREARQAARDADCIICMDAHPNIATLCCGAALHLNCLAQWLTEAQGAGREPTCVQCREKLQDFKIQVHAQVQAPQQPRSVAEIATEMIEAIRRGASEDDEEDSSSTQEESDGDDESSTESAEEPPNRLCQRCRRNQRANSCANTACRECCNSFFDRHCHRHAGST
jgi:fido (protein-threonine AMPylation protein)